MNKFIVTEISSSDDYYNGDRISLDTVKAFPTGKDASAYLKEQYRRKIKEYSAYGEITDKICNSGGYQFTLVEDESSTVYQGDIKAVEIPVTEYDYCYDRVEECMPEATERVKKNKANKLVNDDYIWETFDQALGELI